MSATNRGQIRKELDYYSTPDWAVESIVHVLSEEIEGARLIIDPCAGEGEITKFLPSGKTFAIELHEDRAKKCAEITTCYQGDFLKIVGENELLVNCDLIIANPPFSQALEFIDRCQRVATTSAVLLPLSFLGSATRRSWLSGHDFHLGILSRRPSFRPDGKTDAQVYAWFVTGPSFPGRGWFVL